MGTTMIRTYCYVSLVHLCGVYVMVFWPFSFLMFLNGCGSYKDYSVN